MSRGGGTSPSAAVTTDGIDRTAVLGLSQSQPGPDAHIVMGKVSQHLFLA